MRIIVQFSVLWRKRFLVENVWHTIDRLLIQIEQTTLHFPTEKLRRKLEARSYYITYFVTLRAGFKWSKIRLRLNIQDNELQHPNCTTRLKIHNIWILIAATKT